MFRFLSTVTLLFVTGCTSHHFFTKNSGKLVLYLNAPEANEVLFASSVDNFRAHKAGRTSEGLWITGDLVDREFRYFYIVDGKTYTPDCQYREKDDFGAINCIYQP
jgi:hypothetical protein